MPLPPAPGGPGPPQQIPDCVPMHHDVFGDITYDADDSLWRGRCRLPAFAAFGQPPGHVVLPDPEDDFREGIFPLTIEDYHGSGPTPQQVNAFRYVRENEATVCQAVVATLLESYRTLNAWMDRWKPYRDSH